MSRRRRPRHFREDPWVVGCCGGMAMFFSVALLEFTAVVITGLFGGSFGEGMVYGLVVLGGFVGLVYAVAKRYS